MGERDVCHRVCSDVRVPPSLQMKIDDLRSFRNAERSTVPSPTPTVTSSRTTSSSTTTSLPTSLPTSLLSTTSSSSLLSTPTASPFPSISNTSTWNIAIICIAAFVLGGLALLALSCLCCRTRPAAEGNEAKTAKLVYLPTGESRAEWVKRGVMERREEFGTTEAAEEGEQWRGVGLGAGGGGMGLGRV